MHMSSAGGLRTRRTCKSSNCIGFWTFLLADYIEKETCNYRYRFFNHTILISIGIGLSSGVHANKFWRQLSENTNSYNNGPGMDATTQSWTQHVISFYHVFGRRMFFDSIYPLISLFLKHDIRFDQDTRFPCSQQNATVG